MALEILEPVFNFFVLVAAGGLGIGALYILFDKVYGLIKKTA